MIFATAMATGLFTAMLRSAFAIIAVAFMIGMVFLVAFVVSGASLLSLLFSVLGFNTGLMTLAVSTLLSSSNTTP